MRFLGGSSSELSVKRCFLDDFRFGGSSSELESTNVDFLDDFDFARDRFVGFGSSSLDEDRIENREDLTLFFFRIFSSLSDESKESSYFFFLLNDSLSNADDPDDCDDHSEIAECVSVASVVSIGPIFGILIIGLVVDAFVSDRIISWNSRRCCLNCRS